MAVLVACAAERPRVKPTEPMRVHRDSVTGFEIAFPESWNVQPATKEDARVRVAATSGRHEIGVVVVPGDGVVDLNAFADQAGTIFTNLGPQVRRTGWDGAVELWFGGGATGTHAHALLVASADRGIAVLAFSDSADFRFADPTFGSLVVHRAAGRSLMAFGKAWGMGLLEELAEPLFLLLLALAAWCLGVLGGKLREQLPDIAHFLIAGICLALAGTSCLWLPWWGALLAFAGLMFVMFWGKILGEFLALLAAD